MGIASLHPTYEDALSLLEKTGSDDLTKTIAAGGSGSLRSQGRRKGFELNFQSPVGWAHSCDLAAHHARSFTRTCPPQIKRAQGRPGARCTRGLVCNVHRRTRTRAYRFSGSIPAFPAQWLYGLLRALPGERLSCHRRPREASLLLDLAPAPRRQDHTTSPYASGAYV